MFGLQASSPFGTGTLLLLMVALSSVQLTLSTMLASDGADKLANQTLSIFGSFRPLGKHLGGNSDDVDEKPKNVFASFNLTDRGQSMLGSLGTLAFLRCNVPCVTPEVGDKAIDCMASYNAPTESGPELCDYWFETGQCCLDAACTCSDGSSTKIQNDLFNLMKEPIVCGDRASRLSCSYKTLWIILGVVGGLILLMCCVGICVVVLCCCMAKGGGSHSYGQYVPQPVGQYVSQPVGQYVPQPVGQYVPQPVGQYVPQPTYQQSYPL